MGQVGARGFRYKAPYTKICVCSFLVCDDEVEEHVDDHDHEEDHSDDGGGVDHVEN